MIDSHTERRLRRIEEAICVLLDYEIVKQTENGVISSPLLNKLKQLLEEIKKEYDR
jgi:hypothetical protein